MCGAILRYALSAAAAAFANNKMQRSGRCHESEVFAAFRRSNGRYRSPDVLPDSTLRDMVRNWHPGVERTRTGYLKNVSLQALPRPRQAVAKPGASSAAVVSSEVSSGSGLLDSIAEAAARESSSSGSNQGSEVPTEQPAQRQ